MLCCVFLCFLCKNGFDVKMCLVYFLRAKGRVGTKMCLVHYILLRKMFSMGVQKSIFAYILQSQMFSVHFTKSNVQRIFSKHFFFAKQKTKMQKYILAVQKLIFASQRSKMLCNANRRCSAGYVRIKKKASKIKNNYLTFYCVKCITLNI